MMTRTLRQAGLLGLLVLAATWPASAIAQTSASPDSAGAQASASPDSASAPVDTTAAHESATPHPIGWQPPPARGRPDLLLHASLSFAIGVGVGLVTEEPALAAGTAISLGVAKEVADDHFDTTDLLADIAGAALAALVTHWLKP